jgi:hypothetical protein
MWCWTPSEAAAARERTPSLSKMLHTAVDRALS